jgi:hypothetical protein
MLTSHIRSTVLCITLAVAIAVAPCFFDPGHPLSHVSAWAKEKGGGGNSGKGGGGSKRGGGDHSGSGKGVGKSSANQSHEKSLAKYSKSDIAFKEMKTQPLASEKTKPADASLMAVVLARKRLEEATARFNRALAEPAADLNSLISEIEKAEKDLIAAGARHQVDLARGVNVDETITNSTTSASQEKSQ